MSRHCICDTLLLLICAYVYKHNDIIVETTLCTLNIHSYSDSLSAFSAIEIMVLLQIFIKRVKIYSC